MNVKTEEGINDWDGVIRQLCQQKQQKDIDTLESITAKSKGFHKTSEISEADIKLRSIKDTTNQRENSSTLTKKIELLAIYSTHLDRIIKEKHENIQQFISNKNTRLCIASQKLMNLFDFLRRVVIEGHLIRITTLEFQSIFSQFQYLLGKSIKNIYNTLPTAEKNEYKMIAADNRSFFVGCQKARKNISALSMLKLDVAFLFIRADYEYQHLYKDKKIEKLTCSNKLFNIFDINQAYQKNYYKYCKLIQQMFDYICLEQEYSLKDLVVILCMLKMAYNASILSEEIRKESMSSPLQPQEIKLLDFSYQSLDHRNTTNTITFKFCELAKMPRKTVISSLSLTVRKFLILDELRQIPPQTPSFEKRRILIKHRLHYNVPLFLICTWSQDLQNNPRLHHESLEKIKSQFEPYKWFYFYSFSVDSPCQNIPNSLISQHNIFYLGLSLITCERLKIYNSILESQLLIARCVRKLQPILVYKFQLCSDNFVQKSQRAQKQDYTSSDSALTLIIGYQGEKLIFGYTVKGYITSHEYVAFLERLLEVKTAMRDIDLILYDKYHESKMSKRQIILKLINKFSKCHNVFVYLTSDIKYFKRHFLVYYIIIFQLRKSRVAISEDNFFDKVRKYASNVVLKLAFK